MWKLTGVVHTRNKLNLRNKATITRYVFFRQTKCTSNEKYNHKNFTPTCFGIIMPFSGGT